MNRRQAITSIGLGGIGIATLGAKCGGPSVSGTVKIIEGGIAELLILYPGNSSLSKIVKLGSDFDADWTVGKFDSAKVFFESLDSTVSQVINDLGINASTRAKLLLASLGIAVRVIASIIAEQGQQQPRAARRAGVVAPSTVSRINMLADPSVADKLLKSLK